MHHYILGDKHFPDNPEKAISSAFFAAEKEFIRQSTTAGFKAYIDKSGSTALIALLISNLYYKIIFVM